MIDLKPLIQYFEVLEDPRDIRGKKYKLTDFIIMTIYGILNSHTDFTNIALFLKLREDHYYIMDTKINIDYFARAIRSHWNIETGLHWRLDMVFDEEHSRSRVGNSIENLSTIRKIVFNLARLDDFFDKKVPIKARLTHYNTDFKKIENLLFKFSTLYFLLYV